MLSLVSSQQPMIIIIIIIFQSACWAMAKSWLDVQVDLELANFQTGRIEKLKNYGDAMDVSGQGDQPTRPSAGLEGWPFHVLDQQPRDLPALLQKLHSGYDGTELFIFLFED